MTAADALALIGGWVMCSVCTISLSVMDWRKTFGNMRDYPCVWTVVFGVMLAPIGLLAMTIVIWRQRYLWKYPLFNSASSRARANASSDASC